MNLITELGPSRIFGETALLVSRRARRSDFKNPCHRAQGPGALRAAGGRRVPCHPRSGGFRNAIW